MYVPERKSIGVCLMCGFACMDRHYLRAVRSLGVGTAYDMRALCFLRGKLGEYLITWMVQVT